MGGTHPTGSRHPTGDMPPLQLPQFLHGVALGLCSNACTAFTAFRRSLMKSVSCGLVYGNSRNPAHRTVPIRLAYPLAQHDQRASVSI